MQSELQENSKCDDDVMFVRSKHTMRRFPQFYYYNSNGLNPTLSVKCDREPSSSYNHHEVSVTEIDSYFPYSMLMTNLKGHYGTERSLNTPDRWNDLLEDLERLSISKSSEYDHVEQVVKFTYTVPVIGHVIIRNDDKDSIMNGFTGYNTNMKHPNCLYWDGRFYDPRYVYHISSYEAGFQKFRKLGIRCPLTPTFDNKNIVEIPHRVVRQTKRRYRNNTSAINHNTTSSSTQSQGSGWLQTEQHPYLEIDLLTEVNITHIGTAGRYPATLTFPSDHARKKIFGENGMTTVEYEKKLLYHNHSRRRRSSYIQIAELDVPISYVTQYKIQYYHHVSKKWIGLSDVFSGNSDALTEVVHALADHYNTPAGLYTRYLRITPIAYQYKPYMRVAIYGLNTAKIKKLSNITSQQDNEIEVVSYTVTPGASGSLNAKRMECMSTSYYDDYYDKDMNYRFYRKKVYDAMINDGIHLLQEYQQEAEEDTEDCLSENLVDDMSSYEHVSQRRPMHLSDFICSAGANTHVQDTAINQDIEYEEQLALAQALSLSSEGHHQDHIAYDDASMFTANAVIATTGRIASSDIDDRTSSTDSYIRCSDISEDDYIYIDSDDNTDI